MARPASIQDTALLAVLLSGCITAPTPEQTNFRRLADGSFIAAQ